MHTNMTSPEVPHTSPSPPHLNSWCCFAVAPNICFLLFGDTNALPPCFTKQASPGNHSNLVQPQLQSPPRASQRPCICTVGPLCIDRHPSLLCCDARGAVTTLCLCRDKASAVMCPNIMCTLLPLMAASLVFLSLVPTGLFWSMELWQLGSMENALRATDKCCRALPLTNLPNFLSDCHELKVKSTRWWLGSLKPATHQSYLKTI